jgi:hypothetical protein
MYWCKNRHIDEWNSIKIPKVNPCIFSQLIFDRVPRIQNKESIVSSLIVLGKLDIHIKKNEIGFLSYTIHKN